jgi:hypothetical protein
MRPWACANVSSNGRRSPADAQGVHVHPHPPTPALHVHTRGWEHFQPKSAQRLDYFSPDTASAGS